MNVFTDGNTRSTQLIMKLSNRFFGREEDSTPNEKPDSNLAFILLSEAHLPEPEAIVAAFKEFAAPSEVLQPAPEDDAELGRGQLCSLKFASGETAFVALMPAPIPTGEAEEAAQFSLSSLMNNWELQPHKAHLVVLFHATPGASKIDQLTRFTRLLAAVGKASPTVGVYWGNAGATHAPDFFYSIAADPDPTTLMMLWSGFSIAREGADRVSLLSLGMKQLQLPDMLLVGHASNPQESIELLYELLWYVAQRGEPLPEGDTVGRSAEERLRVHYVPSPLDSAEKVWRVEVP